MREVVRLEEFAPDLLTRKPGCIAGDRVNPSKSLRVILLQNCSSNRTRCPDIAHRCELSSSSDSKSGRPGEIRTLDQWIKSPFRPIPPCLEASQIVTYVPV